MSDIQNFYAPVEANAIDASQITADVIGNLVTVDGENNVAINVNGTTGDVIGNSATATALQTPRSIGGVDFDGSTNIDLPGVNTSGTQDTSGNAATATAVSNQLSGGSAIKIWLGAEDDLPAAADRDANTLYFTN